MENGAKKETIQVAIPADESSSQDRLGRAESLKTVREVKFGLQESHPSFRIPTNEDAACHVQEKHGHHSWQAKILRVIHAKCFQWLLISLLMLDILILFTELFLLSLYPGCDLIVRDAISCCPPSESAGTRWLASDDSHSDICEPPLEATDYPAGCDGHKWHTVHTVEHVLFAITISILSIMMLELLTLMAAISPCVFFLHFFYTLDFFIVAVSLGLEASFKAIDDEQLATYVGAIVLFRSWRFVRIAHGLVEITAEITAKKYEGIIKIAEQLEEVLTEHEKKMAATGCDSDETDSVVEIQTLSKELAEKLIAMEDEDKDKVHLSNLKKSLHLHIHKSHRDENDSKSQADAEQQPDMDNGGSDKPDEP
mmetsp:Transcript_29000/g.52464  ORF Transcript_29000/g.52464 Transcript_29000/m.52464 type:complete len:368 (+) Transcript_29000:117-1220(+)